MKEELVKVEAEAELDNLDVEELEGVAELETLSGVEVLTFTVIYMTVQWIT